MPYTQYQKLYSVHVIQDVCDKSKNSNFYFMGLEINNHNATVNMYLHQHA